MHYSLYGLLILIAVSITFFIFFRKKSPPIETEIPTEPVLSTEPEALYVPTNEPLLHESYAAIDDENLLSSLAVNDVDALPAVQKKNEQLVLELAPDQEIPAHDVSDSDNEYIAINIVSKPNEKFMGYELLQSLLSAGLRFGQMNIFHRYSQLNEGEILFSLAASAKPGTFDMSNIGGFHCQGLTLFLNTNLHSSASSVFEIMLGTARQIAEDLDGELFDEEHQSLSNEKIKEYREKLRQHDRLE